MASCPHCHRNTIGPVAKWWSSPAHPATCSNCGGLSHLERLPSSALNNAVGAFLPILAVIALVITGSLWVLAAAAAILLGVVANETILFYRTPMLPTDSSAAGEARHWERVGLVLLGVIVLLVGLAIVGPLSSRGDR